MPTLQQFEDENRKLFDLLFRHQVYLEGVKSGFAGDYQKLLRGLYDTFASYAGRAKYVQLDQFNKLELVELIRRFQLAQQHFYSRYTAEFIDKLKTFLGIDVTLTRGIFHSVTGQYPQQAADGLPKHITKAEYDDLPGIVQTNYVASSSGYDLDDDARDFTGNTSMAGLAVTHGTDDANDRLWGKISNAPVPANGLTVASSVNAWATTAMAATVNELQKGYANKQTINATLRNIIGTSTNAFRDGLFAKFATQHEALTATLLQHVSSYGQSAIASVYYERYQWVSVLDNRTTEICRSRNGMVYVYGKGPLPPAHYNCRSKAVPIAGDQAVHDIPDDYVAWLKQQSQGYLRDTVGKAVAEKIANGSITEGSFSLIGSVKPLTLEEFASKLPYILGE